MLAKIELDAMREQELVHLERETGEKRDVLLLKIFDFYLKHHLKNYASQVARPIPTLSVQRTQLFQQIATAKEFDSENAIYERYGVSQS